VSPPTPPIDAPRVVDPPSVQLAPVPSTAPPNPHKPSVVRIDSSYGRGFESASQDRAGPDGGASSIASTGSDHSAGAGAAGIGS